MKDWLKENVLPLFILVGVIAIFCVVFFQKPTSSDDLYKYQLGEKADSIAKMQKVIDSLEGAITEVDDTKYKQLDSTLQATIAANNKTIYELRKQRENINVDTLSSADLIRFFSNIR